MYVKNIVICDCEKQYAKNLLQIFSGKKVAGIRLYLFDTVEEAAEFSEKETIHVLLIAGEYFQKLESPIPAKTCFLLTRELSEKAGAGGREIYRYQSAEAIWNRMMEAEKQCIDKKYFPVEETEGEDEEYQKRREKSLQQDKILKSMNPPKDIMDQVDLLTCSINDCWSRYADLIYQYALEDILAFLIERQGL